MEAPRLVSGGILGTVTWSGRHVTTRVLARISGEGALRAVAEFSGGHDHVPWYGRIKGEACVPLSPAILRVCTQKGRAHCHGRV